mmetsp:Transcript_25561/g.43325  ORF Transcript_25561/g.43325 Transcript_25561/m.43325 type:complete len:140 (+) Transcript_25561:16-435(+)
MNKWHSYSYNPCCQNQLQTAKLCLRVTLLYLQSKNHINKKHCLMLLVGVVEVEFRCAQSIHYCVEDTELTSSKSSNHNATGQESNCAEVDKSNLLGNVHQTSHHRSISTSTLLVNLGEKSISRVRDNGSGNSSNNTGSQ